jgi:predicted transcriptional regulator of viral defense system
MWQNLHMSGNNEKSIDSQVLQPSRDALLNYIEDLQAHGRLVFTSAEARNVLGGSANAFTKASLRLIQKNKLFRPASGFYVIVPTEYRSRKSVPAEWYIDALMKFHGLPYYAALLSAAAFHGASHQAPQEFQVVTTKPLRPITTGHTRIRFITKKNSTRTPVRDGKVHTGFFKVSTPEATALDLIRYYRSAGFLNNVSTILAELGENLDAEKLLRAAEADGEIAHAQRLGYLLDQYAAPAPTSRLHEWTSKKDPKFVPLRPSWRGKILARDERWRVLVNEDVEPDI